jgi:hypothetical protein
MARVAPAWAIIKKDRGDTMMQQGRNWHQRLTRATVALAALAGLALAPAAAQVRTVDPNTQIDADLEPGAPASNATVTGTPPAPRGAEASDPPPPPPPPPPADPAPARMDADLAGQTGGAPAAGSTAEQQAAAAATGEAHPGYQEDDLIGAAEGVFGKGAKGLADIIRKTLKEQGEPIGYITGREASGAIGVGLRYGSGTLFHKVEGQRDVYWTGPSLGFDLGGNAASTFVLVYNLYDSQELYHRYPSGEGAAYFVGGFNASYLRWKKVVLIPIRAGVGMRLGANIGYMKFSEKRRWLPF